MASFTTSWIGQTLEQGRFLVGEKLGEGGMAIVFKAHDLKTKTEVVIKVPKQNALEDETFLKRFAAENRALINLRHSHVVSILHVGEFESWPFAVLQYLPGGDLDACREAFGGKLSLVNVSKWLPPIADALDFIHGNGYVHRDVKPANVLFDGQGQVFLSDFGVAKVVSEQASKMTNLTGTGMVLGTPEYMAPELIMGRPIDGRVDQYALAITIYECLAGRLPFPTTTPAAILVMQTTQKVPPLAQINPAISQAVSQTVMRALAKKPAERFPTCKDFAVQFLQAIEQDGLGAAPPTTQGSKHVDVDSAETINRGPNPPRSQLVANPNHRPIPRTKTTNHMATSQRRNQTQESVWQNKRLLLAGGIASVIVALLIITVISRSWRSPETPRSAQDSSPLQMETASTTAPSNLTLNEQEQEPVLPVSTAPQPASEPSQALASSEPTISPASAVSSPPEILLLGAGAKAGQEWSANGLGMTFCWCPPGTFTMGSPPSEEGRENDENQVEVTLTQGFWLGKCEVTQKEWHQVMATTPWQGQKGVKKSSDDHPASYVSWDDAVAFCRKLTDQERQAGRLPEGWKFMLPTEAQWERACRAGTTTPFSFEDWSHLSAYAWFGGSSRSKFKARAVGQKKANPWGLHDVHGNVGEWCRDAYVSRLSGGRDPEVIGEGPDRVARGGAWATDGKKCRSACRFSRLRDFQSSNGGFRVARVSSLP